jgi:tetrahydromethanopterin S-methyltransferase subunit B
MSTSVDFTNKEAAENFVKALFPILKTAIEEQGNIEPLATLVAPVGPDGVALPEGGFGVHHLMLAGDFNENKHMYSQMIRELAAKMGAVVSVFISEAWMAISKEGKSLEEARAEMNAWQKRNKSLESFPGREEILMVSYEHKNFGSCIWRAVIIRDGNNTTLGEFELMEGTSVGRFVRLLPNSHMN